MAWPTPRAALLHKGHDAVPTGTVHTATVVAQQDEALNMADHVRTDGHDPVPWWGQQPEHWPGPGLPPPQLTPEQTVRVEQMRRDAIDRLAVQLDIPVDVLDTCSPLGHWSGWPGITASRAVVVVPRRESDPDRGRRERWTLVGAVAFAAALIAVGFAVVLFG